MESVCTKGDTVHMPGLFKDLLPGDCVCAGSVCTGVCLCLVVMSGAAPSLRRLGICSTGLSGGRGLQDVPASVTSAHGPSCSWHVGSPRITY